MIEYLNEKENAAVEKFLADPVAIQAVKKVLLSGVYRDGTLSPDAPFDPLQNFILGMVSSPQYQMLSMDEKGRKIDTVWNAISLVETGFKQLEKCKQVESPIKPEKVKHR